jgi:gliding motility-associated-like protein
MKIQYSLFFKKMQLGLLILIVMSSSLNAQILSNGDFESGGSGTGFLVNDYTLINPLTGTSSPGFYARTTNPILMNSSFISGGDHTTGSGNMIVVDGSTATNKFFWTTGSTGGAIPGFTPGSTYTFSYWIKSVSNEVTSDVATRSNIGLIFVNATSINPSALNHLAPLPSEGWQQITYSFVATATNVLIRLRTQNAGAIGNDFAVDDFSITEGTLPFEGSYTSVNPTCPNSTDGSITVSLSGGFLPYNSYNLTGTSTQTNTTGIFTGLTEGTYSVSAFDANGQQYSQSNIVLTAPNNLVLSNPVTICEGESTALSVSGGDGSYTWTANPTDTSITNPNSATQNVSPSVTTVYTVTSGTESSTTNLVFNGDFSLGNTGFTTEYTQIADPSPFGVQSSYDIVTNPNDWFSPFASCGDHTTGTGNLMVFDGSTDPTGTIKAWCSGTPIAVTPNTSYTFSYYVASVAPQNPAKLEVLINGVSLAAAVTAPTSTCLWTLVSHVWNSGTNTTADICIYDREFIDFGNDFALDDISLVETATCLYEKSVTVTVNPQIVPAFNPVAPICEGDVLNALPTTSLNGYTGTWSPALNNLATTTYLFTPTAGQCAANANLTIIVNPIVTPTFNTINPICLGSTLAALPTTSVNGITGTWFPSVNNSETTTYTFTPNSGQCASTTNVTIVVNPLPEFSISEACEGLNYTLSAVEFNASNSSYQWYNSSNNLIGSSASVVVSAAGTYKLVVTQDGCSSEEIINVISPFCSIQNGISPNNDGLNDNFDLASFNVSNLKIFNRYGTIAYDKSGYENEWYGQSNQGDQLPDGTYYYVIDFTDLETKTGWIYINRER